MNALNKRNEKLKKEAKPLESEVEFEKAWEAAHPPRETHLDAVLNQTDYGVKLVGIDHISIGSDFDGVSGALPAELKTVADYPNLVAGLQGRGYKDTDIRKFLAAICCVCGIRWKMLQRKVNKKRSRLHLKG